mgnify:CR=1 FL=1
MQGGYFCGLHIISFIYESYGGMVSVTRFVSCGLLISLLHICLLFTRLAQDRAHTPYDYTKAYR